MDHDFYDPEQTGRCQARPVYLGIPGAIEALCLLPREAHQSTLYPETFEDSTGFARAVAAQVIDGKPMPYWVERGAIGHTEVEYAIEPSRGADARCITDELVTAIEELPDYRDGAAIITRHVTYGPWRYVIPEEFDDDDR